MPSATVAGGGTSFDDLTPAPSMAIRMRIAVARPVLVRRSEVPPVAALHAIREDFRCIRCGHSVTGNGYTNHCPRCLWSVHVDVHPGDRAATCRAPMAPVDLLYERGRFVIVHECTGCGLHRRNRASADDHVSVLLE